MGALSHMILIGMNGCGRAAIGRQMAAGSKRRFVDVDDTIIHLYKQNNPHQKNEMITLHHLYDLIGNNAYQAYECLAIETALASFLNRRGILSIGGGTLFNSNYLSLLSKRGRFFYLRGSFKLLYSRWLKIEPLLNHITDEPEAFHHYYQMHDVFFSEIADITLDIDTLSIPECIAALKVCCQKQFWHAHLSRKIKNQKPSKKIFKKSVIYSENFDTNLDIDQKSER
jgi:shikimate kinase